MRTMLTRGLGAALVVCAGCGVAPAPVGETTGALRGLALLDTLPACGEVARPTGRVAVEDVTGSDRLIVRTGAAANAVCAGTIDELVGAHLLAPPLDVAENDPMPADGQQLGANDPMPADGTHGGNGDGRTNGANDPMPADGTHSASNDPMPARHPAVAAAPTNQSPLAP